MRSRSLDGIGSAVGWETFRMAELFKFRCYHCEKLLGVPRSKIGSVVRCPRCGAELAVPSQVEGEPPPPVPDPDAFRPEDLGLNLDPGPSLKAAPPRKPEPEGPNPIAFLEQIAEAPPDDGPDVPADPPALPEIPDPLDSPLSPIARRAGRSRRAAPSPRRGDVILPRTAAIAWAMFGLMGMAFAFASGLVIGHFLWK